MGKTVNILLVEDDEVDVMNMKRAFRKRNIPYPLFTAENGVVALEMLKDTRIPKPTVIILDLNMPKMGGLEFLSIIRNEPELKDISVVVMTTSNKDSDKINAYSLNVSGYVVKPLSGDDFLQAVGTLNNFWQLCEFPD